MRQFLGKIGMETTDDVLGLEDLIRAVTAYLSLRLGETRDVTETGIRDELKKLRDEGRPK